MTPETKTAHTRGPWQWEHRHPDVTVWGGGVEPDDEHVASVYGDGSIENAEANARLIAAAPELLEALKEAVSLIELWHGMHSTHATLEWQCYQQSPEMQRLNAVIAKAEGR